MRILMYLILLPLFSSAQYINVLNLKTNDILYNPHDQRIYASTPSTAGINGNSICIINPITTKIDTCVFIGSEPNKIAIADSGTKIFVALDGSAAVREFNLLYKVPGQQFTLGNSPSSGPYYAEDLEVLKGSDHSIAVSRRNINFSPKHEGVAIYDHGIRRTNTTSDHTGSNVIEAYSNTRMVGYNNESSENGLRIISIDANGVQEVAVYKNMINGYNVNIHYSNAKLYTTSGQILDLSSDVPFLLATLNGASGPVVEDTAQNMVCYAFQDFWSDEVIIKKYSLNTFTQVDSIYIKEPLTTGEVVDLINWGGKDKLAYNTDKGKVVIIGSHLIHLNESEETGFTTFPNPAEDFITLTSNRVFSSAEVAFISTSGKVLENKPIKSLPFTLDLSHYPPGAYFLKITSNQKSSYQKIIKK